METTWPSEANSFRISREVASNNNNKTATSRTSIKRSSILRLMGVIKSACNSARSLKTMLLWEMTILATLCQQMATQLTNSTKSAPRNSLRVRSTSRHRSSRYSIRVAPMTLIFQMTVTRRHSRMLSASLRRVSMTCSITNNTITRNSR